MGRRPSRSILRDHPEGTPEWSAAQAAWLDANPRPPCHIRDVADHIEHIRAVAGVDHVGLGSDFDGTGSLPDGLDGVHRYPALLAELAARGWSDPDLGKLTWHNALRVLRATESAAARAQRTRGASLATFAELDHPSTV
jgi:membrane dipeptidase